MATMPRVQAVVLPILRTQLAAQYPDLDVVSWGKDPDHRTFPYIMIRRLGGYGRDPLGLDKPTIEMTVYSRVSLPHTEQLYLDAREVLVNAVANQTITEAGYLHSFQESMGPTQFDSPWDDTWRIQGLIQLGLRPPRN